MSNTNEIKNEMKKNLRYRLLLPIVFVPEFIQFITQYCYSWYYRYEIGKLTQEGQQLDLFFDAKHPARAEAFASYVAACKPWSEKGLDIQKLLARIVEIEEGQPI